MCLTLFTAVQPQLACNAKCYLGMQLGLLCFMHMSLDSFTDRSYAEAELRFRNRYDCSDTTEQG